MKLVNCGRKRLPIDQRRGGDQQAPMVWIFLLGYKFIVATRLTKMSNIEVQMDRL